MIVYVFGNPDVPGDDIAIAEAKKLEKNFPEINFVYVKPNEDLPFADRQNVILMDAVEGISDVTLIDDSDLGKLTLTKSVSVHDFDLGFQLKYLKKLRKIGKVTIIGLPGNGKVGHLRIQSILRKLVEQDMQGS